MWVATPCAARQWLARSLRAMCRRVGGEPCEGSVYKRRARAPVVHGPMKGSGLGDSFVMYEIGTLRSPFPHRAGTPRQGMLAPSARSCLELHKSQIPAEALDQLDGFSHVWVIFRFHINVGRSKRRAGFAAKVMPPRAGVRVGVFSTRSPHRPNPIGLSLARIDRVDCDRRHVWLNGLDLVDGTPVYDIKPYIPLDSLSLSPISSLSSCAFTQAPSPERNVVVPAWVTATSDTIAVSWTDSAAAKALAVVAAGYLAPLYPSADDATDVMAAVVEVVAQDPRAIHHGRGTATKHPYGLSFSQLRIYFEVRSDRTASIVDAELDPGDPTAPAGTYQHSLAQTRAAECESILSCKSKWNIRCLGNCVTMQID